MRQIIFIFLLIFCYASGAHAQTAANLLDDFENIEKWGAAASDDVSAASSHIDGKNGKAISLDYDFNNRAGYAVLYKPMPIDFPQDYEISFYVRGKGLKNTLEIKFVDASGDNVWWYQIKDFTPSENWQLVRFKKRHISLAWGPTRDKTLRRTEKMEFVLAAINGGKGNIEIDDLTFTPIIAPIGEAPKPKYSGSSENFEAAFDNDKSTIWRPMDKRPGLHIDYGQRREFGGISLYWGPNTAPISYEISASNDQLNWETLAKIENSDGGYDAIQLRESDYRHIRLITNPTRNQRPELAEFRLEPLSFGADKNAFLTEVAKEYPRGYFPRSFSGEQTYWTLLGVNGGGDGALIGEDGNVEIGRWGYSIEPFIIENNKLSTWADVRISHSLLDKYLPIPSAKWLSRNWDLNVTATAIGDRANSQLVSDYVIRNRSSRPLRLKLALMVRPMQVNPPTQFLSTQGGYTPINSIKASNDGFLINEKPLKLLSRANQAVAATFDQGQLVEKLARNSLPQSNEAIDKNTLASGIVVYEIDLAPRQSRTISLIAPISGEMPKMGANPINWAQSKKAEAANYWRRELSKVDIRANGKGQEVANAIKTSLANILIMRDGPNLRPGARSYARSWIRDGAMISEGLLRLGHEQAAKDYLNWFAPYQFDNGKIPCCVDFRGSDPVAENDSQGEFIYLAAEILDYTKDRELIRGVWPRVKRAAAYMNSQRVSERTSKNQTPDRAHLYGLLPPSISHEGYSSKPAYSHWDNFWGLRGYYDATYLARQFGSPNDAINLDLQRREFEADILASLEKMPDKFGIDFIPGAADLGDFDATSTTIALSPGNFDNILPADKLEATFNKYWANFLKRRDIDKTWKDYTPYEWRVVGAFTRLGQRERALAALDFFMNDRAIKEWNAWGEVVARERRKPFYLGDLPHGWVASDFIRSSLDMFAYEKEGELILGAGVDKNWLEGEGINIRNLRTTRGLLSIAMRYSRGSLWVNLTGPAANNFIITIPVDLASNGRVSSNIPNLKRHGEFFSNAPNALYQNKEQK